MRIQVLGGFQAFRAGQPVVNEDWGRPSAMKLVKLLAVQPSHRLHRDHLLDLLWPHLPPQSAGASLRNALHRARRALEPNRTPRDRSACITMHGQVVMLTEQVEVDADVFERAAGTALDGDVPEVYVQAIHLYRGDLLPEDRYDDWVRDRREALRDLYVAALIGHATLLEQSGGLHQATSELREAARRDPLREDIHRQLIRLYITMGDHRAAIAQFEQCADILRRELDMVPDGATLALIHPLREPPPPQGSPRSTEPFNHRVPADNVPLVGRSEQLTHVLSLLSRAHSKSMVMVRGERGAGKTRFAEEVARHAEKDGMPVVWLEGHADMSDLPFGPFLNLLSAEHMRQADTAAGGPPSSSLATAVSLSALLGSIGAHHAALVVIDNLHAFDRASVGLIRRMFTTTGGATRVILSTYSAEELHPSSAPRRLISSLDADDDVVHISLPPLNPAQCASLIRHDVSGGRATAGVVDAVTRLSAGIPLWLRLLAKWARDDGTELEGADVHVLSLPPSLLRHLYAPIERLETFARRLLQLLSTHPGPIELDTVLLALPFVQSSPWTRFEVADVLQWTVQLGLLTETEAGFTFRLPLLQSAIYASIPRAALGSLHEAMMLAHGLRADEEPHALLWHLARAETYMPSADSLPASSPAAGTAWEKVAFALIHHGHAARGLTALRRAESAYAHQADPRAAADMAMRAEALQMVIDQKRTSA